MSLFWLLGGLLILLALVFVLWPLLKSEADPFVSRAALLRDQLSTLQQLESDGLLSAEAAAPKRSALKEELLKLVEQSAAPQRSAPALPAILVLAVLLPLLTVILYQRFGTPNALHFTSSAPTASASTASTGAGTTPATAPQQQGPDLAKAAESLAARLADTPEDVEGWTLLARTWQELGEFEKARDAYARVYKLKPEDPELLVDYAQSLGLASNPRSLLGEPRKLLEAALKIDPAHQRGLWLYGYAQRQAGELEDTLETWDRLLTQLPPSSQEAGSLTEQINIVRRELGLEALPVPQLNTASTPPPPAATATPAATAPAAATPTASTTETAGAGTGLRVQVQLDPALAAKVGPNDVLYVFARAQNGPPMPLAIQRVPAGQLPFAVTLTDEMAMTPAMKLSMFPQVIVGARISKSGNAIAASGDLQGFSAAVSQPHGDLVEVLIKDVVP